MATTKEHSVLRDLASAYGQSEVGVALRALFDERDAIKQELTEARNALIREGMARDEWARTSQGWEDMHALEGNRHAETREALRAARADLEYERNTAATLRECWQDVKDRLDMAVAALRASAKGGDPSDAYAALDEINTAEFARSAPVSAAPTAPKPFEPCQRCACGRAPVISALGESRFRVWCEGCGEQRYADGESPDAAVSAWNKIAATPVPPAPEAPTVARSEAEQLPKAAFESLADRAGPIPMEAPKGPFPKGGTGAAAAHGATTADPCCPVALETHGLSHGDACPAGAALLPCPRCGLAPSLAYGPASIVFCTREACDHSNYPPAGRGATMDAAKADWNRQVAACPAGAGKGTP